MYLNDLNNRVQVKLLHAGGRVIVRSGFIMTSCNHHPMLFKIFSKNFTLYFEVTKCRKRVSDVDEVVKKVQLLEQEKANLTKQLVA